MKWWARFWRQRRCDHEGVEKVKSISCSVDGVTLSWGASPVINWRWDRECVCGKKFQTTGYLPREREKANVEDDPRLGYDEDGWPLLDGKRMRIAG